MLFEKGFLLQAWKGNKPTNIGNDVTLNVKLFDTHVKNSISNL